MILVIRNCVVTSFNSKRLAPTFSSVEDIVQCLNISRIKILNIPDYLNKHMDTMLAYPVVSGVLNGYNNLYDTLVNDNISRLANITLKSEVKLPGELSKFLSIVLTRVRLNRADTRESLHDCGTNRTLKFTINNEKDLAKYRFKYYKGEDGKFDRFIDLDSYHLIGKELEVRSILTCDGEDIVCHKCYGANNKFARDNNVFKVNIGDEVLVLLAAIFQGIDWSHAS